MGPVAYSYHFGFSASARCMSSLGGQATQVFYLFLMSVTLMALTGFALMAVPWVDFLEWRYLQQVRTVYSNFHVEETISTTELISALGLLCG